jgi:hypothetical protein
VRHDFNFMFQRTIFEAREMINDNPLFSCFNLESICLQLRLYIRINLKVHPLYERGYVINVGNRTK